MIIFSRPALWIPGMNDEEWADETEQMLNVAFAVQSLNAGVITFDDFEDVLNENSLNPIQTHKDWAQGFFYA